MCRVSPKVHLGIDEDILEVWAVEITTSNGYICDDALLTELLCQVSADHKIASVTADRAYDPHKLHDVIAQREAVAVILPGKNAKPWKIETACAVARNEAPWASKCLGRHSCGDQVISSPKPRKDKMHCVKRLVKRLIARDFGRQVAKFQLHEAVRNGYTRPASRPEGREIS